MRRDPQIAAFHYDWAASKYARKFGPYHWNTLRAQAEHAAAMSRLGELQQAEAELAEVIIRLNPLDDRRERLLVDVRRWHHHVLARLGWLPETEADARFVAESYARQLGPDHPDTLYWRQLTALAAWDAGHRDEAKEQMADVKTRRAVAQGANHPDTLKAQNVLSAMTSDENAAFRLDPRG